MSLFPTPRLHLTFSARRTLRRSLAFVTLIALMMPMLSLSVLAGNLNNPNANRSSAPTPAAAANVVLPLITATKTDALLIDNDNDNVADTGDTLKYTVTITNSGSTDATGVMFNDTVDANTTLDPLSITTTPIAIDDTYSATGNVQITIGAGGGVLANDNDADGNTLTASAGATSANGGNVSMNANGGFTYNPPAGFEGTDTFTYTITDGTTPDTATVSINVSGMIWFIDNSAAAGGDGRLTSPFNALTGAGSFAAVAADDPGDNIFLYTGSGDYNGGLTLLANQRFIGQGAGQSLSTITGLTPPSGSLPLPSTGGLNPKIVSTSNGINLGSNNLVRGLDVGNVVGAGISGSAIGTLTVREVTVDGTGQSLNLSNGTLDAVFTKLSSTNSGSTGISLASVAGSLVSGPTDVNNSAGAGISVASSSADINFGATSSIGSGGTGVSLQATSGDITFSSLNIAPDAGQQGLFSNLHNTGTITATSGAVNTSNAIAIQIAGTSPALRTDLNLTLTSVTASNSSHGIVVGNTSGSFAVIGTGGAGSGGTISNMTSRGASFIDATNITLNSMGFSNVGTVNGADPTVAASTCGGLVSGNNTDCAAGIHLVNVVGASFNDLLMNGGVQQGINGNNVTTFALSNSQVLNFGDQTRENGIQFRGLFGTSSISNSMVSGNEADQVLVQNSSGPLGTLNVSSSTFSNSASPNGNSGLSFNGNATANMSVVVSSSTFSNNTTDGLVVTATNSAAMAVNVSGSTFQANGNTAMSVSSSLAANTTYNISNNPVITGHNGNSININLGLPSTGTLQGTIANNVIGTSGVPFSGSNGGGTGINVISNGSGSLITAITNNAIHGFRFGSGINIQARDGNNSMNATVTGNTINLNSATASNGILVNSGAVGSDTVSVCADISGNNIANDPLDEIRVRRRFTGVTFRLPGFGGTTLADVNNFLAGQNTLNGGSVSSTNTAPGFFVGGLPCTSPSVRLMQPSTMKQYLAKQTVKQAPRTTASRSSNQKNAAKLASMKSLHHAPSKKESNVNSKATTAPRVTSAVVGSVNLNIGTLPAGKSVVITFNVAINNSVPPGTTQVSNQGLVTGDNFADVLTDDPDVGGAADPTVTPIQAMTPPDITCPADITVAADSGSCSKSVSFTTTTTGSPTPTVDCKIGATSITSPHTFPVGTTTVTCTASNGVPPDDSCSFTVTVTDPDAPVITINGDNPMTVECGSLFTDPGATANDLCAGSVPVTSSGTVDANTPGTYIITYSATDGTNTATATRTVNVVDTTAPVITLNGANPMTVECHTTFTDPGATAVDSCDGSVPVTVSGTVNADVPGTYTLTYTATDGTNSASVTRTVNVVDTIAPVITINGANPATVECHTSYSDAGATATDSCAGSVAVTTSGSVNVNVPGAYTITYTAFDGFNTATATRTVNVVDTIAPVITVIGANPATVECHTSYTDAGATATDSCAGSVAVTTSGSVNVNVPGTYTLTYTAFDGFNTATATRTVNVVDTIAPVITINGPNPMTIECHTTFTDPGATATDSCAGSVPVSSASNVNPNVPGTYQVTYTATDGFNTSTATRTVIVIDSGLPVINLNGQSLTLWPPNHQYVTVNLTQFVVSASDGCDGTIDINDVVISKVTSDEPENSAGDGNTMNDIIIAANCKSVQLRSERQGSGNGRVYTIHFRVKDAQGNIATATAKVKVPKSQGNNGGAVEDAPQYTVNGTCP